MSRPATFKAADLDRALAVAEKRGLPVAGYEITADGTIRVLTAPAPTPQPRVSELERWRQKRGRDAG